MSTGPDGPAAEHVYEARSFPPPQAGPAIPSHMSLNVPVASVSSAVPPVPLSPAAFPALNIADTRRQCFGPTLRWKDERKSSGKVCLDDHGRAPAEFQKAPKAQVM